MARVKGAAIAARVEFLRQRFGNAGLARVLQRLEPAQRAQLEGILLPQTWHPIELLVALIEAAEGTLGQKDGKLCREMARYAAEANLTTLYKFFYRISSVGYVLSKAASLWSLHYDSGKLVVEDLGPKRFRLRISNFEPPSCTHCASVFCWAERSVELSGGKHLKRTDTSCRKTGAQDCHCEIEHQ